MNTTYSQQEIERIVELASENPKGFLNLASKYCQSVSVSEVERSMRAWGINTSKGFVPGTTRKYGKSSSNRSTRSRENISYSPL